MDQDVAVVIEDGEDIRELLAQVLTQGGFTVHTAADGATGVELVRDHDPIVVTVDVNMPGIDGNETTRRLRASGGPNAGVPVIGFSAGAEPAQVAACRAAGMTDWLPKPLEPRRLYAALEQAMTVRAAA